MKKNVAVAKNKIATKRLRKMRGETRAPSRTRIRATNKRKKSNHRVEKFEKNKAPEITISRRQAGRRAGIELDIRAEGDKKDCYNKRTGGTERGKTKKTKEKKVLFYTKWYKQITPSPEEKIKNGGARERGESCKGYDI